VFEIAKPFLLSLALGLAIGIERERAHAGEAPETALGARTFTLIALLGTLAAHVTNAGIAAVLGLFVAALVVATYLKGQSLPAPRPRSRRWRPSAWAGSPTASRGSPR
jgi:hypothetical protein